VNKVFIFDLDDTLYWNVHDYCYPILEFEKFMLDILGHKAPHITVIRKLEGEIDRGRVKKFGYSMERFPGTLVETYKTICSWAGVAFDKKIAEKIWQIGMKAFDPEIYKKKGLVEGVEEVLNFLKKQGDGLALLTRGDERVQQLKINALRLARWFYHIHIVPSKGSSIFRAIAKAFKEKNAVYSVGNSLKSDIEPALEAGLSGIYIPCETWEFDENKEEMSKTTGKGRLFIFKEIIEIRNRYKEL